jgi:hypothetical protein
MPEPLTLDRRLVQLTVRFPAQRTALGKLA